MLVSRLLLLPLTVRSCGCVRACTLDMRMGYVRRALFSLFFFGQKARGNGEKKRAKRAEDHTQVNHRTPLSLRMRVSVEHMCLCAGCYVYSSLSLFTPLPFLYRSRVRSGVRVLLLLLCMLCSLSSPRFFPFTVCRCGLIFLRLFHHTHTHTHTCASFSPSSLFSSPVLFL